MKWFSICISVTISGMHIDVVVVVVVVVIVAVIVGVIVIIAAVHDSPLVCKSLARCTIIFSPISNWQHCSLFFDCVLQIKLKTPSLCPQLSPACSLIIMHYINTLLFHCPACLLGST